MSYMNEEWGKVISVPKLYLSVLCIYIFFHLLTFFVATFGELLSKYGGEWLWCSYGAMSVMVT